MNHAKWTSTIVLLLSMLNLSCNGGGQQEPAFPSGTRGGARSGHPSETGQSTSEPALLSGDNLDAINLAITHNALGSGLNRPSISPALAAWMAKYNGIKFKARVSNVTNSFEHGVLTQIGQDSTFAYSMQGALLAEVRILNGTVGLADEEIYVANNTQAQINGLRCRFDGRGWIIESSDPGWRRSKSDEELPKDLRVICWRDPDDKRCKQD